MMSSENPFYDPARPYEKLNSPRKVTSIVVPPKSGGGIVKSLNLSDENPFHDIYANYHYPSQVDPTKRITTQAITPRSTENKSLNLSDDNPFHATYGRYQYPSANASQKRFSETPRHNIPLIPLRDLSDDTSFGTYRPSLIREYSTSGTQNTPSVFTTSIAEWIRNNPVPVTYRPYDSFQIKRPSSDFYRKSETPTRSSYIPPISAPRQPRSTSPPIPTVSRVKSQPQKVNPSLPLEKTSLNMSPDNPFIETYGRYHYPSSDEIKAQKRANERHTRVIEKESTTDSQTTQITNQSNEHTETETKETTSGKANGRFARFDITF